jgi:hypothetical protein
MEKQQATTFIQHKIDQGLDHDNIARMLAQELHAPVEPVRRFVAQIAAQYRPVFPSQPAQAVTQPQSALPAGWQDGTASRAAEPPPLIDQPLRGVEQAVTLPAPPSAPTAGSASNPPRPAGPDVLERPALARPQAKARASQWLWAIPVVIVFAVLCVVGGLLLAARGSPAGTVQPTATPIPGWERFEGAGVELWLPQRFDGGDLTQDLDVIVSKMRTLGPDFEQTAKMIESNPSAFAIWAFDTKQSKSGFLTNVNIVKDRVLSATTLDAYVGAIPKNLPASVKITGQDKVNLERYEAARMTLEMDLPGVRAKELVYVIKNKNVVWVITYAAGQSDYPQLAPIFEQSANTFLVKP